jgi:hypothetical protein
MAPLEFVIVFPLLLALTAALFLIARADLAKSLTATTARHDAWAGRATVPAGSPLALNPDPAQSLSARTATRPVPGGPLFKGEFTAESRAAVYAHPWDWRGVPFDGGRSAFEFHDHEFSLLIGQIPELRQLAAFLGGGMQLIGFIMDPTRNPVLSVFRVIGPVLNAVVVVAGMILEYGTAPLLSVLNGLLKPIIWATEAILLPWRAVPGFLRPRWVRRLFNFLNWLYSVEDMLNVGTWACHNLYAASQGRKGNWQGNILVRFMNFRPNP